MFYYVSKILFIAFPRYCKDIANLLLRRLWECLIMSINNDAQSVKINLKETLVFLSMQKMNFIPNFFSEIL